MIDINNLLCPVYAVHTGIGGGLLFFGPKQYHAKPHTSYINENDHGNDDMKKNKKLMTMMMMMR
jgi:hypothetical protein